MDLAIDKFDKERFGLITGSKCSVLFPKKSAEVGQDTYARQLAIQLYFEHYDEVSTWQTEHGNFSENTAYEHYHDFVSKDIERGYWKRKGNCGGTSDAVCPSHGVDFKCPTTLEKWMDYMFDGITDQQYYQCQMYMYLFERDMWQVCAFLNETERMTDFGLVYPVPQNKRMIVIEVQKEIGWAEKLEVIAPKIIAKRDEYFAKLEERFGKKQTPIKI